MEQKLLTLRITQAGPEVKTVLDGGGPALSERRPFSFMQSAQNIENIRWYLEDYPIYPVDPAPTIAKDVERLITDAGHELFKLVLAASDIWVIVRDRLSDTRIEIETEAEDVLVPWELMRDPVADSPLALNVASFVRFHSRPARCPISPSISDRKSVYYL